MIKGAIFDADGTLIDSMPMWIHFASGIVSAAGVEPEPGLDYRIRYFGLSQTFDYLSEKYPALGSPKEVEALCMKITDNYYRNEVVLKPGVAELLDKLYSRGVKMYIATATYRSLIIPALERLGIYDMFEGIVTCHEVGAGKEKPDVFLMAQKTLGVDTENLWVFEDAMHAMTTAKGCGYKVCGVYDDTEKDHVSEIRELCDIYVESFTDLDTSLLFQ